MGLLLKLNELIHVKFLEQRLPCKCDYFIVYGYEVLCMSMKLCIGHVYKMCVFNKSIM